MKAAAELALLDELTREIDRLRVQVESRDETIALMIQEREREQFLSLSLVCDRQADMLAKLKATHALRYPEVYDGEV